MRVISLKSNDLEDKGPIRLEHGRTQASNNPITFKSVVRNFDTGDRTGQMQEVSTRPDPEHQLRTS